MFVLPSTIWVRNSLFITVKDEMFSLMKISKLYKPCMCLMWSQERRCLYIALSLSLNFPDYYEKIRVLDALVKGFNICFSWSSSLVSMHCSSVSAVLTKSLGFWILFILAVICKVFYSLKVLFLHKITCVVKLVHVLGLPRHD